MHRLFALAAFVGFGLSLAVHISALLGVDVSSRVPSIWLLHLGIFVVFVPFVILSRNTLGPKPTFAQIRGSFPAWIVAIGVVVIAYAIVNFLLFMINSEGGSPSIRAGKFILQSHGHFIRELTSNEYAALKANEVRGLSGHWLAFYYMPLAYFMFNRKAKA